jgi:alpha-glucosidase
LKNPDGSEYRGRVWPGITVFADYFSKNIQQYWTEALQNFTQTVAFSGLWLDMNEPASFSEGSTGSNPAEVANVSTPFALPDTPGNNATTYTFPECYDKTMGGLSGNISVDGRHTCANTTALDILRQTNDFMLLSKRDSRGIDLIQSPQVDIPAFDIHNVQGALNAKTVAMNATSQNGLQQYHWHNLYGYMMEMVVNNAIQDVYPNKRPFILGRSTFAGAGRFTAHWLGDNTSLWTYLLRSIQGVLQFQFFQLPMVGPDTGGFNGNTDEELANRWHSLSGFFPFFRNHNTKGAISQEPYVWDSVAEAARTVLAARYKLLPYWETLFYDANHYGTPPLRPIFFSFDDPRYYSNSNQFMIGENLLVTPVLQPNVTSVVGVLPRQANTQWRNFFTHELVQQDSDVVRLDAPLSTIPVHIRSGSILLLHRDPGYTIYETKQGPYALLVYVDSKGYATGCAKVDDGMSLPSE